MTIRRPGGRLYAAGNAAARVVPAAVQRIAGRIGCGACIGVFLSFALKAGAAASLPVSGYES
jgi:hypothetical protein